MLSVPCSTRLNSTIHFGQQVLCLLAVLVFLEDLEVPLVLELQCLLEGLEVLAVHLVLVFLAVLVSQCLLEGLGLLGVLGLLADLEDRLDQEDPGFLVLLVLLRSLALLVVLEFQLDLGFLEVPVAQVVLRSTETCHCNDWP